MRYLLHLSYFSCKYGPSGKSREGEGEDTLGFINSKPRERLWKVSAPTFFLSKELAVHGIISRIQISIPQPLLKLLFLLLCKETSVYFMNLRTAVLEKHSVFCLSTSFISNGFNWGFKALSKSNYDIIWNICPSNNPWLILSSLQGLRYIHSRCFGIRPWFGWTLERRISWPKW